MAAENLALRQQLMALTRNRKRAPDLQSSERFIFAFLAFFINLTRLNKIFIAIKPATILKFHRSLVKRKYQRLFSNKLKTKPGPKGPSDELTRLIIEMKNRNPGYGYLRITMQINEAFGLDIDKGVVRRILQKQFKSLPDNNGPSWLTFLGHMKDSLWSVDLFRAESITLKSHWILVVMDQCTRRIIGFAVHNDYVDGSTLCFMFNKVIQGSNLPKYLSSDHDPLFRFHQWQANLRILGIKEIKTVPYTPESHPFIERLIGTVRRELLDRLFFWNQRDLERKLAKFQEYYNHHRCHSGNNNKIPDKKENNSANVLSLKNYRWQQHCAGLFELPIAA